TSNEHALYVNKGGTGSFRPLNFYNNGTKLMSLDTAATITTYSNIILGAGGNTFVYINGNNNTLYPSSATGVGAIGWNFQSSAIDFWNTFTSATDSFAWRQLTGVGTQTTLMVLGNTGKITRYANISTAGQGLSTIYGSTLQKSETGADTNVLTYTPPSVAGRYRVTVSISVTAATLGWTLAWTDSNSHAQTPANLPIFTQNSTTVGLTTSVSANVTYSGSWEFDIDNSGANIIVKTTFTGTYVAYKISAIIEQLA